MAEAMKVSYDGVLDLFPLHHAFPFQPGNANPTRQEDSLPSPYLLYLYTLYEDGGGWFSCRCETAELDKGGGHILYESQSMLRT